MKFSIDELRKELSRILAETEMWDGRVNVIQVTNLNEKTMELRALISAKDSGSAWDLRVHVREKLIEYVKENHPEALPKSRIELEPDKK